MAKSIIAKVLARPELLKSAYPPINVEDLKATEEALGFELPNLLREIYLNIGNGGFGPHFGGFKGGINGYEGDDNIVTLYTIIRSEPKRFPWPDKLLPFFEWGCQCRCSLDCTQEDGPVIFYDPCNDVLHYAEDDPDEEQEPVLEDPVPAMTIEAPRLESWLKAWLNGTAKMGYHKPL